MNSRFTLVPLLAISILATTSIANADVTNGPTALFGIELGSHIELDRCPIEKVGGLFGSGGIERVQDHQNMCWGAPQSMISGMAEAPESLPSDGAIGVYFASMRSPSYAPGGSFNVTLKSGQVYTISMEAGDLKRQGEVIDRLKKKFGQPSKISKKVFSNSFGASFDAFNATWLRPSGDVVEYQGYIGEYSLGIIKAMVPAAAQADAERRAKLAAPPM